MIASSFMTCPSSAFDRPTSGISGELLPETHVSDTVLVPGDDDLRSARDRLARFAPRARATPRAALRVEDLARAARRGSPTVTRPSTPSMWKSAASSGRSRAIRTFARKTKTTSAPATPAAAAAQDDKMRPGPAAREQVAGAPEPREERHQASRIERRDARRGGRAPPVRSPAWTERCASHPPCPSGQWNAPERNASNASAKPSDEADQIEVLPGHDFLLRPPARAAGPARLSAAAPRRGAPRGPASRGSPAGERDSGASRTASRSRGAPVDVRVAAKPLGALDEPEVELVLERADLGGQLLVIALGVADEIARDARRRSARGACASCSSDAAGCPSRSARGRPG